MDNKHMKWVALAAAVVSVGVVNYITQKQNEKSNEETREIVAKSIKVLNFDTLKKEVLDRKEGELL